METPCACELPKIEKKKSPPYDPANWGPPAFPVSLMHVILLARFSLSFARWESLFFSPPHQTRRSRARRKSPAEVVALHIVQYILAQGGLGSEEISGICIFIAKWSWSCCSLDLAHILPNALIWFPSSFFSLLLVHAYAGWTCKNESHLLSNLRDSYGGHINRIKWSVFFIFGLWGKENERDGWRAGARYRYTRTRRFFFILVVKRRESPKSISM